MVTPRKTPSAAAIQRAKHHPGKWLYEISGDLQPGDTLAPERILGAWKIDAHGEIVGDFVPRSVMAELHEPRSPGGSPLG